MVGGASFPSFSFSVSFVNNSSKGCVLHFAADMETVEISEVGFVPGHPSFYSPVLLDKEDIDHLMKTFHQKDEQYKRTVSEFIKGHRNVSMVTTSFSSLFFSSLSFLILVILFLFLWVKGESEEFKKARMRERRMTLKKNEGRFLLPLVPLFTQQRQRQSQMTVMAVEQNLNDGPDDLSFKVLPSAIFFLFRF